MIPEIDLLLGISVYSTSFSGIGGRIRENLKDFVVSEILSEKSNNSIDPSNGYAIYKLKKMNIDTNHAISDIFRKRGIKLKALGLKDSSAITEQYVCSMIKNKHIENIHSQKYSLDHIGFVKKPLSKKDMVGNHFKITISNCKDGLSKFDEYSKILNFFGYQRFGSKRPVTHLIGKALLQKNFKKAIDFIVSYTSPFDSPNNNKIRDKFCDKLNYEKYFDLIPPQMDIERIVIKEMIEHNDEQKAIRALPLQLRRFYIQAYQSFLFNYSLSLAFKNDENLLQSKEGDICFDGNGIIGKHVKGVDRRLAMPIVGYSYYKKTRFDPFISEILQSEEVAPKDFFIREMQEISSEGGFRQAMITCDNYSSIDNTVEFTLSRGSFATILLREIMKPHDPLLVGF